MNLISLKNAIISKVTEYQLHSDENVSCILNEFKVVRENSVMYDRSPAWKPKQMIQLTLVHVVPPPNSNTVFSLDKESLLTSQRQCKAHLLNHQN